MSKLKTLQKRTLYLLGSIVALVSSYVIVEDAHSTTTDTPLSGISIREVFADVPSGDAAIAGGDDSGDGN